MGTAFVMPTKVQLCGRLLFFILESESSRVSLYLTTLPDWRCTRLMDFYRSRPMIMIGLRTQYYVLILS